MEKERSIEIILSLIFIIFLLIIILLVISFSNNKNITTNSYNTYVVNNYEKNQKNYYEKNYHYNYDRSDKEERYLEFSYWDDEEEVEGVFGNQIQRYYVYVENQDYKGGYFTVKFYFIEDGKKFTDVITHYIKPGQTKKFFHQTVTNNYDNWDFNVISKTKI